MNTIMKRVRRFLIKSTKILVGTLVSLYLGAMIVYFGFVSWNIGPARAVQHTYSIFVKVPIRRFIIPVSSDEDMIAFFRKHRLEFERITHIQREKCLADEKGRRHPEVLEITERVGLRKVWEVSRSPSNALWFENPYSVEAVERAHELHAHKPGVNRRRQQCPYRALEFFWENYPLVQTSARWGDLIKGWVYFPVAPRVEKDRLYFPNYLEPTQEASRSVLDNLDKLPKKGWREHRQCLYRKIDANWFLFVCPIAL